MGMWKHLYLLPLSVFIGFVVTFFTTYAMAVQWGHVKANFPYISDGGTCPPESCIFGQMLNITAVLLGLTVYVRYSLVEDYYSIGHQRQRWERWMNCAGWFCGTAGALGMSIVGNFQETNLLPVHLIGAMMAFFLGVIYCWIQVPITYRTRPEMTRPWLFWVRLATASICTGLFGSGWSCAAATPPEFTKNLHHSIRTCNASVIPEHIWGHDSFGWKCHICSTASEWALALLFASFLLTFVYEFRLVTVEKPKVHCGLGKRCHQASSAACSRVHAGSSRIHTGPSRVITGPSSHNPAPSRDAERPPPIPERTSGVSTALPRLNTGPTRGNSVTPQV